MRAIDLLLSLAYIFEIIIKVIIKIALIVGTPDVQSMFFMNLNKFNFVPWITFFSCA